MGCYAGNVVSESRWEQLSARWTLAERMELFDLFKAENFFVSASSARFWWLVNASEWGPQAGVLGEFYRPIPTPPPPPRDEEQAP